jgi:glycosyltransferase involved in cell wall biosynthesis
VPLVSAIIPTRNRRALVGEAVASVLAQREADLEVIVVDDGSTDGTRAAIAGLPVRYVYQPPAGVSAARNHGARRARGEWLAFLDSDDLWRPRKLAAQLAFHRRYPEVPVSQTEEIWVRNGRRINPARHHRKPAGDIFVPSLARCLVSPSAVMLRRALFEAVGGFDESLAVCEDYDLWLRLACRVPIGLVPEALVVKRGGHPDQLSRQHWGMDRFRVAALVKLLATEALDGPRRTAAVETLVAKCAVLAQGARRRGRTDEADRYLAVARAWTVTSDG